LADDPADPFATMPWRPRRALQRRLRRVWREGMAAQRADMLIRLRTDLTGVAVASAASSGAVTEVAWADGTVARLWLCHRPAVEALRTAGRDGHVVLVRADHHGHFWALYFATLEGRLPVLCRDLRINAGDGGTGPGGGPPTTPTRPSVTVG
jgi:hypothetical protein